MEKLTIKGIQEAQQKNLQTIASLRPSGSLGRAVVYMTTAAHRYSVANTHVQTGALRASHRMEIYGLKGRVYIDPFSVNPKGAKPSIYGVQEHARGGSHAFYQKTYDEAGLRIATQGAQIAVRGFSR